MIPASIVPEIAPTSEVDIRSTIRAWEDFLSGKEEDLLKVCRVVSRSWRRSLAAGVDPSMMRAPRPAESDALWRQRRCARLLVEASRPIFGRLDPLLNNTQSILLLADARGLVLDLIGDPHTRELGREAHIDSGATWSEGNSGTNAIGTALADNVPVQIHASEHFCAAVKSWTCAAAPVHDPLDGELMGIFDISGPRGTVHPLCLALAMSAAGEARAARAQRYALEEYHLSAWLEGRMALSGADAVVLLDRKGRFVRALGPTTRVRELMRRVGQDGAPTRQAKLLEPQGGAFRAPFWAPGVEMETLEDGGDCLGAMLVLPADGGGARASRPSPAAATPDRSDPFWRSPGGPRPCSRWWRGPGRSRASPPRC